MPTDHKVPLKCKIQWTDCKGQSTGHDTQAAAVAVLTTQWGIKKYPICAEHLSTLVRKTKHHDKDCVHASEYASCWSIISLEDV